MTEVRVPFDVEAEVIAWLASRGINAQTELPTKRVPGMIRVTRVGGEVADNGVLDQPELLVEVWGASQEESFDTARLLYATFALAQYIQEPRTLGVTSTDPTPPVTYHDEYAPDLYRHQFTVSLVCKLDILEV